MLGTVKSRTDSRNRTVGLAAGIIVAIVIILAAVSAFGHSNASVTSTSSQSAASSAQQTTTSTSQSIQTPPANSQYVQIGDLAAYPYNGYSPPTLTVYIGVNNTVVWQNVDPTHGAVTITASVVSTTGLFNSGDIAPGAEWWFTFTTPGTYAYYNGLYPSETGVIVVKSS